MCMWKGFSCLKIVHFFNLNRFILSPYLACLAVIKDLAATLFIFSTV